MKHIRTLFILCGAMFVMAPMTAFGANGTVIAQNNTPDEDLNVEVMIDGASYILSPDNEYRASFECNTDTPQIAARVTDDPYEFYECAWEDDIDLASKNILTITVGYSENMEVPQEEDDGSDTIDPNSVDWDSINYGIPDTAAEEIDLSNGAADTGTLVINCKPVYAFKSVTLTLQGEDYKDYNITLHLDKYFFKARVKLPAGKYRETGTPEIEFQDNATTDSERYSWNRTGKTAFGGFITVPSGGEISVTDYEVVENIGGQTQSASSTKLLNRTQEKEKESLMEKQDKEFYQKTYQNLTVDQAETPEEKQGFSLLQVFKSIVKFLPIVGIIAIAAMLICVVLWIIKMYKNNNRRR